MKYHFTGPVDIMNTPQGQYIVGIHPWVPYTPEKFEEIKQAYENRVRTHEQIEESMKTKTVEVSSKSNPDKTYELTIYTDGRVDCSCKGFMFRKNCNHVNEYKEQNA